MTEPEIKPCPFCGGRGVPIIVNVAYLTCEDCHSDGPQVPVITYRNSYEEEKHAAIRRWNQRVEGKT